MIPRSFALGRPVYDDGRNLRFGRRDVQNGVRFDPSLVNLVGMRDSFRVNVDVELNHSALAGLALDRQSIGALLRGADREEHQIGV